MSHPEFDIEIISVACTDVLAAGALRAIHEIELDVAEALRLVRGDTPFVLRVGLLRDRAVSVIANLESVGITARLV